jgi:hypothetical protein
VRAVTKEPSALVDDPLLNPVGQGVDELAPAGGVVGAHRGGVGRSRW